MVRPLFIHFTDIWSSHYRQLSSPAYHHVLFIILLLGLLFWKLWILWSKVIFRRLRCHHRAALECQVNLYIHRSALYIHRSALYIHRSACLYIAAPIYTAGAAISFPWGVRSSIGHSRPPGRVSGRKWKGNSREALYEVRRSSLLCLPLFIRRLPE